jgi:hypothetical protein
MRIAATLLVLVAAGFLRAAGGHELAYLWLGLCIAVPRIGQYFKAQITLHVIPE